MTVYFIGAGPGAADLLTVRAQRLVRSCGTCLYEGAVVSPELLALCPPISRIINTARMPLAEVVTELQDAETRGDDVALLLSGDPSLYSHLGELVTALDEHDIAWEIVPGVPAYAAAAAALRTELTASEISQSLVLTRVADRSAPMPEGEDLSSVCASGATAVIHIAAHQAEQVREELLPIYGPDTPVAVAAYVSRPEEVLLRTTLSRMPAAVADAGIQRSVVLVVGAVVAPDADTRQAPALRNDDRPRTSSGRPTGGGLEGVAFGAPVAGPYEEPPLFELPGILADRPSGTSSVEDDGRPAEDAETADAASAGTSEEASGPAAETSEHRPAETDDRVSDGRLHVVPDPIEEARRRQVDESELAVPDPVVVEPPMSYRVGPPNKILLLGGTTEGRELANLLDKAGLDVVTALPDRVKRPRLPHGEVRLGGFGGPEGLGRYLYDQQIDLIIDATTPTAERISSTALQASMSTGVPVLRMLRPEWTAQPGDEWLPAPDAEAAARIVQDRYRRPLLTIGQDNLAAFSGDARGSYLIRCEEPPEGALPRRYLLMFDRGPFDVDNEHSLLRRHRIDVVVTTNSGGEDAAATLEAARALHIPVVMIQRPPAAPVPTATSVAEAAQWIVEVFGAPSGTPAPTT